jgi:nucleoside-diphosphate-sugar epimerase
MTLPRLEHQWVLVTGGAGFIGSHLVDGLLALDARIRVLDNLATGRRANLAHCATEIEFVEGDIRNLDHCRQAVEGCSVVFHQAALGSVPRSMEDPATSFEVNVQGTVIVFTAAKDAGVDRLVYASSSSVYGDSRTLPKVVGEEGKPLSPYAATKQMNEQIARVFAASYGFEAIGLRYFNIYGPRQDPQGPYAAVVPRFFKAALQGEPMVIHGDGEQSRDFTHVSDAVRANLLAAGGGSKAVGRAYNVAAGHATTVNELAREIASLCGGPAEPIHEPPRAGDVKHSLADLDETTMAIGYGPRVDLAHGLATSLEYYQSLRESP